MLIKIIPYQIYLKMWGTPEHLYLLFFNLSSDAYGHCYSGMNPPHSKKRN